LGFRFGFREDRQKQSCQNGDDGNNDKQFDEGEG
jgi:hypothetical protein